MAKNKNLIYLLVLIIGFTTGTTSLLAVFVPTPVIVAVDQSASQTRPLITGLTAPHTEVLIYVNGTFRELAKINETKTATNNFYYSVEDDLDSGKYSVVAIARDKTSLLLSTSSGSVDFVVADLPAPTLLTPNKNTTTGNVKPVIIGLSESQTTVHIFIDGVINGNTGIISNELGTANFAYNPFLNLSIGQHQAWAVAVGTDGRKSKLSNVLNFNIEAPMPAPTLLAPVVNSSSTHSRPFVVGLTHNDSLVKVFIDGNLDGEFMPEAHASGITSFAYKPFLPLSRGQHQIYVTATDLRGKVSAWSNSIDYFVNEPSIGPIAVEEEIVVLSSESVFGTELTKAKISKEEEIDSPKDSEVADSRLDEILGEEQEIAEEQSGLINEDKERQGRLRWNLVIFILFLATVIIWIFWVNRELIKEKQEQDKSK